MRKLTFTLATAACALIVNACQDGTAPVEPGQGIRPEFNGSGSDFQCVGVVTGTFDNVVVPPGADCTLLNSFVRGSVKNFGSLGVNRSTVRGNVDGEPGNDHTAVFNLSTVFGSVQIKGSFSPLNFGSGVFASTVHGDFQYVENRGRLDLFVSTIRGNVKSEKNTGGGFIQGNTIGGNVECKENTPPHVESFNTIGGDDKCPE
jgi:hypothetical protein